MSLSGIALSALVESMDRFEVTGSLDGEVIHVTHDSRKVRKGSLFVAIDGIRFDGHEFIDDAVRRGAMAVISERKVDLPPAVTGIWAESSRQALADVSAAFFGWPARKLQVVGVTGTNGKTSVCYFLQSILQAAGKVVARLGTTGHDLGRRSLPARMTTPKSIEIQEMFDELVKSDTEAVVMEVSSHALSQERVRGIDFRVAVFTNLSQDHLDYHSDMTDYLQTKRRLFEGLASESCAVLNKDDPASEEIAEGIGCRALWYGRAQGAEVTASALREDLDGSSLQLITPGGEVSVCLPVGGDFTVSNFLAAAAAATALDCSLEAIAEGAATAGGIPGRAERVEEAGRSVLVDYAHTPAALDALLGWAAKHSSGDLVVIFGAGGDRDRTKRPLMGRVAVQHADRVILTSDNPRSEDPNAIVQDILSGIEAEDRAKVEVFLDRKDAIRHGIESAEVTDTVIIAGKGHERIQAFHRQEIPFDDREIAREVLQDVARRND